MPDKQVPTIGEMEELRGKLYRAGPVYAMYDEYAAAVAAAADLAKALAAVLRYAQRNSEVEQAETLLDKYLPNWRE